MATTLRDKIKRLPLERQERIDAETDRLHDEYKTIQEPRKGVELTQVKIANTLDTP